MALILRSCVSCGVTKENDDSSYNTNVLQGKGVSDIEEDHPGLTDTEDSDDSRVDSWKHPTLLYFMTGYGC